MARKPKKLLKGCLLSILIIIVLFILLVIFVPTPEPIEPTTSNSETIELDKEVVENPKEEQKSIYDWQYSEHIDKMTEETYYTATLLSMSDLNFKFPYDGGSKAYLYVRYMNGINEVMLSVKPSQFMMNQTIRLRINDKLYNLSYSGESTGKTTIVFLESPDLIIEELKTAVDFKIEAPFYQEGKVQMFFLSDGFKWNH